MENITFALALLLGTGFFAAKLGQLLRLPSVTGYICAGLLLGPTGFNLISAEASSHQLSHFTQIALMLIAFGIGEHLELRRLKTSAKNVLGIGIIELSTTFVLVGGLTFFFALALKLGSPEWDIRHYAALGLILGAVAVATAPAATLHVMRELRASGPLTTMVLAVIAIDNGFALMIFGVVVTTLRHFMETATGSITAALVRSLLEIGGSMLMGIVTGLFIDLINDRLKRRGDMMTIGLALLLLCGELARYYGLSPMLAGMAAGFTIVNRDRRDIRIFRALNSFEPPVYVLFFTLAGAHLDISSLNQAGWLGLIYFLMRACGKNLGTMAGTRFFRSKKIITNNLGLTLLPQAGVAIGLIFLISGDKVLSFFSPLVTPVVLASVFLSELVGPIFCKYAVTKAGEADVQPEAEEAAPPIMDSPPSFIPTDDEPEGVPLVPWTWSRLVPPANPDGCVLFGTSHMATGPALSRMSTILAHYYKATPFGATVIPPPENATQQKPREIDLALIDTVESEARNLGYHIKSAIVEAEDPASGLLAVAQENKAHAIVLGHSLRNTPQGFDKILGKIINNRPCPVLVIRFCGVLHTEKILIPIVNMRDLYEIRDVVRALANVGRHAITLLRLMPSYEKEKELAKAAKWLHSWAKLEKLSDICHCKSVATDARLETILKECASHDILIMRAPRARGLQRLFFGSLTAEVMARCNKPVITVYGKPKKNKPADE